MQKIKSYHFLLQNEKEHHKINYLKRIRIQNYYKFYICLLLEKKYEEQRTRFSIY